MQIIKFPSKETWAAMLKRPTIDTVFLGRTVANILKDVRENGDSALRHCARHFDKVELEEFLVTEDEFLGAEERRIHHRAGSADLDQSASDFLFLYGLPNFFFHLTMGYAALRSCGVTLGKADFDGFHAYPPET